MADPSGLSHFDAGGNAHMVDVSDKAVTSRVATARGVVEMSAETLDIVRKGHAKKGDVLATDEAAFLQRRDKAVDARF